MWTLDTGIDSVYTNEEGLGGPSRNYATYMEVTCSRAVYRSAWSPYPPGPTLAPQRTDRSEPVSESARRPGVQGLAELVAGRMYELGGPEGPLSLRAVVTRSGDRMAVETLRRIIRGDHQGNVSDRVAEGLSIALSIPLKKVYEAAGLPQPSRRWDWSPKFDRLSMAERQIVEDVARGFLHAYERGRRDAAQ